jgi:hypothetical protein
VLGMKIAAVVDGRQEERNSVSSTRRRYQSLTSLGSSAR